MEKMAHPVKLKSAVQLAHNRLWDIQRATVSKGQHSDFAKMSTGDGNGDGYGDITSALDHQANVDG